MSGKGKVMKRKTSLAPISLETIEEMVAAWTRIFRFQESGSIYCHSKSGLLYRLDQFLKNDSLVKKYFAEKDRICVLDLETSCFEEEEEIEKIIQENEGKAIFLLGADKILEERNNFLLEKLNLFVPLRAPCSVLLFFHTDFTHPSFLPLFKKGGIFLQNIIFHPLYSVKDTQQFIKYFCEKWGLKIKEEIKKEIIKNCGGRLGLVKQCLRFLRDNPKATSEEIFSHPQLLWRVKIIWERFLPSEKSVLEKIVKREDDFDSLETHSLKFLQKVKGIKKVKGGWMITVPLLAKFIEEELNKPRFEIKNDHIYLNNVLVDKYFSPKEKRVFGFLIEQKNRLVSREKIARLAWREKWLDVYSDWALDQTISRLRKKLKILGINPLLVKTVKKKGFKLVC